MKSVGTAFTNSTSGFVPNPGGGGNSVKALREDGSFAYVAEIEQLSDIDIGLDCYAPLYDPTPAVAPASGTSSNRRASLARVLGLPRLEPGGRLTLTSGTPVTTSVASSSVVYYTPFIHDGVWLYDGTRWLLVQLPEIAMNLGATAFPLGYNFDVCLYMTTATASSTDTTNDTLTFAAQGWQTGAVAYVASTAGGLTAGTAYWVRVVTGTTVFSLHTTLAGALANTGKVNLTASITAALTVYSLYPIGWTSDTTRYSSAPNYNIVLLDGKWCPNDAGRGFLYLGTFRTAGSAGSTIDTPQRRLVYNAYNQVPRSLYREDTTASWTYTTNSWRVAGNNASNYVDHVVGLTGQMVDLSLKVMESSTVFGAHYIGISFDAASTPTVLEFAAQTANTYNQFNMRHTFHQSIGYHYYYWMEFGPGSGTTVWYGTGISQNGFRGFTMG